MDHVGQPRRAVERLPSGCRRWRPSLNHEDVRRFLDEAYPRILANLVLVTRDRGASEDALQEALARAWAHSERGVQIRSIEAWVGVVALNLARTGLRRLAAERRARLRSGRALPYSDGTPVELEATADLADLRAAVSALPRRQREAIFLRYFLDLDVAEVAEALGVSEGTAKKALFRARATLAQTLVNAEEGVKAGGSDAQA